MLLRARLSLGLAWGLFGAGVVWAQSVGGSIHGTVRDAGGAVLAGTQVVVRSVGTGSVHERATDPGGRYLVPLLPPGEYEVHFSLTGFGPVARRGVRLTVGQDAVVDATLQLGQRTEELVVEADASRVNLTSGAVSGLVGEEEIRDLPLNGRSFQQLALLQPGVQAALAAGNDVVGGRTPKISINGARPEQNNFLLDGTDINNVYNKTPGSAAGVLLGVDAVLEFQVLTNAYSAEFGRSAGGVINAVTRSGANRSTGPHSPSTGTRPSTPGTSSTPPTNPSPTSLATVRGDPGRPATEGPDLLLRGLRGPDRAAGDHGGHRRARRRRATGDSRPAGARAPGHPRLPGDPVPARQRAPPGRGRGRVPLLADPAHRRALLPAPPRPPAVGERQLFARFTYDLGDVLRIPADKPPISNIDENTRNTYITLEHQHTFSPSVLNMFRVGLNRSVSLADNARTIDIPASMSWLPGEPFGYLTIRGMVTEMAGDFRLPRDDRLNNWQVGNTLIVTRGRHSARFGVQAQYLQFDQNTTSQKGGIVNFPNLESFLAGRATASTSRCQA